MLRFGYILGEPSAAFGWSSRNTPAANKHGADELLLPQHPTFSTSLSPGLAWGSSRVGFGSNSPSVRSRCDCFNGLFQLDLNEQLRAQRKALAHPFPQKAA